jgi:hypothetical protein
MLNGTYYLNNSGSRWVNYTNGKKDKLTFAVSDGTTAQRTVIYYESFGNFAVCCISWGGKKIKVFADTVLDA